MCFKRLKIVKTVNHHLEKNPSELLDGDANNVRNKAKGMLSDSLA